MAKLRGSGANGIEIEDALGYGVAGGAHFGAKTDAVRCYPAPSAGYTMTKASATVTSGLSTSPDSSSGSSLTRGGGAGILVKVDDKADVNFGYRYLGGPTVKDTNIKATVAGLYAGINVRF